MHVGRRGVKDAGGAEAAFLEVAAAPMMGDAPPLEGEGAHAFLVEREHLSFGNKLDQGNYGVIYSGEYRGLEVAIKQLSCPGDGTLLQKYVEREMLCIMRVSHPNIVETYGFCFEEGNLYIVMEYLAEGDLRRKLSYCSRTGTELLWTKRVEYALDIARAMQYLHGINLMHRDLKSSNLLIGDDGQIKLCDFGFTREMPSSNSEIDSLSAVGTDLWAAPEVLTDQPYGPSADVFSFAMVMCELMTLTLPPVRRKPTFFFDTLKLEKRVSASVPKGWWHLLCLCAANIPSQRPSFDAILECLEILRDAAFLQCIMGKRKSSGKKKDKLLEESGEAGSEGEEKREEEKEKTKKEEKKDKEREGKTDSPVKRYHSAGELIGAASSNDPGTQPDTRSNSAPQKLSPEEKLLKGAKIKSKTPPATPPIERLTRTSSHEGFVKFKERIEQKYAHDDESTEIKDLLKKSSTILLEKRQTEILSRKRGMAHKLQVSPESKSAIGRTTLVGSHKLNHFGLPPVVTRPRALAVVDGVNLLRVSIGCETDEDVEGEGKICGTARETEKDGVGEEKPGDEKTTTTIIPNEEEEEGEDSSEDEGTPDLSHDPLNELASEKAFLRFKEKMEQKLAQKHSSEVRNLLPRTVHMLHRDGDVHQETPYEVKTRRERRESRSFVMHDRAVVYMMKNIASWFRRKILTIECSWNNSLQYFPGNLLGIRVVITCSHPSPNKCLNGKIFVTTRVSLPPVKKKKASSGVLTASFTSREIAPVDLQSTPQEVSFPQVFGGGRGVFKGEVLYTIPPLEEMLGPTSDKCQHKLCFEFHLSTRSGLVKDPIKGELAINIKALC